MSTSATRRAGRVTVEDALGGYGGRTLADDARHGLTQTLKQLPPKHLYDTRGAALFDRICELPEYYPTRTERAILERTAAELIATTGAGELVELGSGSAAKTRLLLDAMATAGTLQRFVAVDVTEQVVRVGAAELTREYPGMHVHGLIGDVWEWTASEFAAYPGFRAHPYREYSEVFFGGSYRVLRGGSFATSALVATPTFRNWDLPARRQIFAGLRVAADA